jgi:carboxylate-amine ligase
VDEIIRKKIGEISSDVDNGAVSWSNELTAHVIELKTSMPVPNLHGMSKAFHENIQEINKLLESEHAMLLPTAAHPTMDPFKETKLWEHEYNEVYALYNQIFDCRGHGWSNLQSFHINLPFQHDIDFEKLHAAIRVILPIIPALSASSPILDGKFTQYIDGRMEAYSHHQERMPSLMGKLIPEQVFTEVNYHKVIYEPILKDIRPFDKEKIMDHHFLNSRGAIARFDRGAIEIRVIDVQECPLADMAICNIISALLKELVDEKFCSLVDQKSWHEHDLRDLFDEVIKNGSKAVIHHGDYLKLFGQSTNEMTVSMLWKNMYNEVKNSMDEELRKPIEFILSNGNLSERILKHTSENPTPESIVKTYKLLAACLQENRQLE